jgi:Zn-dependent alcohol dehydrogenase
MQIRAGLSSSPDGELVVTDVELTPPSAGEVLTRRTEK